MSVLRLALTAVALLICTHVQARPLRIIHTNDLHGHLDRDPVSGKAGYAAVKATIDRMKAEAHALGVETLTLDAGDVGEGELYYFADRGYWVYEAINKMGYDAVVLGNHDWLMGPADLDWLLGVLQPRFPYLTANYQAHSRWKTTRKTFKPYVEIERAGAKIAILGLSTNDPLYSWRNTDGRLLTPSYVANQYLWQLKPKNDFVIALTHLGVSKDKKLARTTDGFDLIVGGHSHTRLNEVVYESDYQGRPIPIVQAGSHGERVGDLWIDIEAGQPLKVLKYELVPVDPTLGEDAEMVAHLAEAEKAVERTYGSEWLHEQLGESEVKLESPGEESTAMGNWIVDGMKEATGADLAVNTSLFNGADQPAGPITRETILRAYPRLFDFGRPMGWSIWTTRINGAVLAVAVKIMLENFSGFTFAGLTYDWKQVGSKYVVKNIRLNGKRISPFKGYTVAFPEGIPRGGLGITPAVRVLLRRIRDTGVPMWVALEERLKTLGGVIRSLPNTGNSQSLVPFHRDNLPDRLGDARAQ